MIKDHPREVSIVTSEDAQSALYALLTTRYGITQPGATPTPTPPATTATAIATAVATATATAGAGAGAAGGAAAGADAAATAGAPAAATAASPATANGGALANGISNSSAQVPLLSPGMWAASGGRPTCSLNLRSVRIQL